MKVSIITTTYNDAANLRRTMQQVAGQDYPDIEYIIVDGGSSDETPEVLKEAEELFRGRVCILSEPDHGIYNAINKGIRLATGELVGCCFDQYADKHVISRMVEIIEREGTDGVHGDLLYMDGERIIRKWHQGQGNLRFGWLPGHPTFYIKRSIYEKYGLYKEDYKVSADYEFMIRSLKDGSVKLSYLPEVLIHMAYGGTSSSGLSAYLTSLKEGHRALKENGIRFAWFTDMCRTLRVLRQFL
ncbi:MAG: glycosyltransferase [Clostridiales bacterium]|nr:glycosyltransferase [Clostridiales bacterium]